MTPFQEISRRELRREVRKRIPDMVARGQVHIIRKAEKEATEPKPKVDTDGR